MGISREVRITVDGETYTFSPSNRLMRRIDAGLAPQTVTGVIGTMDGTNVPLPALAYIISEMVAEGGGSVDEDEMVSEMMHDMQHNEAKGVMDWVRCIGECLAPPKDAVKNLSAPAKTGGKKGKAKKPKT